MRNNPLQQFGVPIPHLFQLGISLCLVNKYTCGFCAWHRSFSSRVLHCLAGLFVLLMGLSVHGIVASSGQRVVAEGERLRQGEAAASPWPRGLQHSRLAFGFAAGGGTGPQQRPPAQQADDDAYTHQVDRLIKQP
jgi:hypothetical protein